ncbi:hypothetical protein [uncultured Sphingomonas sp.]|uniref:hypothetical protein n=1 Tax=uncultured Sphingomonas sp. TaxID=158754 RepID=UPI0025F39724|nr:hypothetical protein [uncultured Sphingomonas sp.]
MTATAILPESTNSGAAAGWPLFEVTVEGYDPFTVSARSRGAAIYDKWLSFRDVWPDCTFRHWLNLARVRRASRAIGPDPYDYVRRNYDRAIGHGTRVAITGEGRDLEGRVGTLVHPGRTSTAYAHVVLDGDDHAIIVHPLSVVLVASDQSGVPQ